jgi:hypothetical protein
MSVKSAEIKYMHCNISLYSNTTSQQLQCNKTNFTDIPLYFLLQQQLREDIIKADCKVNIFIIF